MAVKHRVKRTVLDYGVPVFHYALPKYLMKDLERVQKRALSIICPLSDYDTALQSLGIERLHTHHQRICVDLFGKIEKHENHRLGSFLPPKRDIHYGLRNARVYNPKWKTSRFKNTFFIQSVL